MMLLMKCAGVITDLKKTFDMFSSLMHSGCNRGVNRDPPVESRTGAKPLDEEAISPE